MLKNRGIAFKLILFFTLSSALIFIAIVTYNYFFSRKIIEKDIEEKARNLALATVNRIEAVLRPLQKVPENVAYFMEYGSCNKEDLLRFLREVVKNNPEVYGSTVAFEPYASDRKSLYFAPYFYKNKDKLEFSYLGGENYQYFHLDWYQIPKELNRPDWSEPYFDEGGGNILMATYSVPFYKVVKGKRQLMGIVTADISLEWLREIVSSVKILRTGYGFLISKNGTLVTHPRKDLIMNATLFGLAEERNDPLLRAIGKKMIKGEAGFISFKSAVFGRECWMYYAPIASSGWSLAVVFPQDELLADITRLNRTVAFLGIVGVLLLSIAVVFIARTITGPLRKMAQVTHDIGTGNLDFELPPVKSGDEVGKLTEAFQYMKTSLKDYIKQLTETAASKEKIESELKIAHDIQMSILPKVFPPFPDRKEFDIYATIEPAREVGGDFYDFFFIDPDHLFFVIADVSGKGVPAALFMAMTKTLIKSISVPGMQPGEILTKVNYELNQANESCMFVTTFCGILNTKTGEVHYTNAGHNPPLLIRQGEEATYIEGGRNVMVGAVENYVFKTDRLIMESGDVLFMYTDGVTEAMNEREELFSDERLRGEIVSLQDKPIREMIAGVKEEVISFAQGAPQSDDIAMMILIYRG
ncbi:MAG: HAMP domain-containing protein [Deltaproteobacteria bacterium]|nr:HAMP domain-containing protein [Deltaproteobacteria bacterium]